ncbi:hypothetical protein PMAYCL1PPCAC_09130, partial [Pristionchus mayeri]
LQNVHISRIHALVHYHPFLAPPSIPLLTSRCSPPSSHWRFRLHRNNTSGNVRYSEGICARGNGSDRALCKYSHWIHVQGQEDGSASGVPQAAREEAAAGDRVLRGILPDKEEHVHGDIVTLIVNLISKCIHI